MRVLVACEFSGVVRDAFTARGHFAMSCDLLPSETPGPHHQGDVLEVLDDGWDLMVAHPPCTDLAVSGARWFPAKVADGSQQRALDFVRALLDAPIPRIALENPVMHKYAVAEVGRKQNQTVQPWMFGDPVQKAVCLWLVGLPILLATGPICEERHQLVHKMSPSADRAKKRSVFFPGIAAAMADQWGRP